MTAAAWAGSQRRAAEEKALFFQRIRGGWRPGLGECRGAGRDSTVPSRLLSACSLEKRQRVGKARMRDATLRNRRQIGDFFLPCTLFLCQYALINPDKVENVKPDKKSEGK